MNIESGERVPRITAPVSLPNSTAGRGHVKARLKKHSPRAAERLTEAVFTALDQQSVVVVGTGAAGIVLPKLAEPPLALRRQRDEIAARSKLRRNRPGHPPLRNLYPR